MIYQTNEGVSVNYPIELDASGKPFLIGGNEVIVQSITDILNTDKGSLILRPNYGSLLSKLVHYPNNSTTWNLVSAYIKDAVLQNEPRIRDLSVSTTGYDTYIDCVITFFLKTQTQPTSFTYRFFTNL